MSCCNKPGLMSIEEAQQKMLASVSTTPSILALPLEQAPGYVLADDVFSPLFVPPFDNSAMDGYAVRMKDLHHHDILPLAGKAFAGQPFNEEWPDGTCIRIMTGAKIPNGCDAVIMQEETTETETGIQFQTSGIKKGSNIRPRGDDISQGDIVLEQGIRLTPRDIPMLASLGITTVSVYSKPKVAVFSTGDELRAPGEPLAEGQIYDSNRYGLKAMLQNFGCEVTDLGIIPDCPDKLRAAFSEAQAIADLVITSGGVSVGEADYTKDILQESGEIHFWKIAIKPGKPFAFGKLNTAFFCGLPGNPVSAAVTAYVLVQPMIARLSGHKYWQAPVSFPATSKNIFRKKPGRTDYQRGVYTVKDGKFEVETTGNQSSGAFRSMSQANCFVILEQDRGKIEAGEVVQIQPFNHTLY
ncbi:molybdopterin molybdotransferase [Vibrio sp. HA2012]|uniref:molybdopterin molybdotransferase MoeA n=1 Tax=Vibrio sp. HA2012 TaxID=1971595 RepID=UPI000C2C4B0C|nr:molybdopterin molybdotransferase MoeA [Vibrio sp. HA2012]PJC87494.1 molybdopterin molybdotransferase [Vibrio sp. HA2012]